MTIQKVKSADGTTIAFETAGQGPPLILVGGAFNDRTSRASGRPLAALLAPRFTVFSYDRRARGDSGDTPPYAVDREVQDLAALIAEAGGAAYVYGMSSGALLALDAAIQQLPITRLALFEPPLMIDAAQAQGAADLAGRLAEAAAEGRRADAVELFLTKVVQVPAPAVAQMRKAPVWSGLESLAHTLSFDLRITARGPSLFDRARSVRAATLALRGDALAPWMGDALRALVGAIPGARERTLSGQTHDVDPNVLAEALREFFVG
jgi:pimeloyl-ACP methyl ester carboxylesterase